MTKTTKHKTKVPKLRFKEFSWEWGERKLIELSINWFSNWVFNNPNKVWNWYKLINVKDMYDKFPINTNTLSLVDIDEKDFLKNKVEYWDIFFTRSSLVKDWIAFSNINLSEENDLTYDWHLIKMKPNKGLCYPIYLVYLFKTINLRKQFVVRWKTTTMTTIGQEDISTVNVKIPSLPEQQKIADFLSSIDDKIEKIKEKKKLLEEYKKWVMQKIFSQEIRFKDENWKNFENWKEKKLWEIWDFQTSSIDKVSRDWEKEVFLINYMNVYRHELINNLTKDNLQKITAKDSQILSNNLKQWDILFTPSSETPDDIWHSVVIFEDLDNCVYSYHLMRFRPKIQLNILYSHYFCNIPEVLNQLSKLSTWSTRFTISVKSFSSIEIKLPSLKEQEIIANFLSWIDKKIEKNSLELESVEKFKKGLLQSMFV